MKIQELALMAEKAEICWINKNIHGTANLETARIRINLETAAVEIFLHEAMHLLHPMLDQKQDETVIDDLAFRVYKKLTKAQIRTLADKILKQGGERYNV